MTNEERVWIQERIARTKEMIVSHENALVALASGHQSYTLDTGQTRQVVTENQVSQVRLSLAQLELRLSDYQQRLAERGVLYVYPGW